MKKNNKKLFVIIGGVLLAILLIVLLVLKISSNKRELSLSEKRWIEDNKKSMIDIYVMNNLPIFTSSESDIFLSFLNYFESETGLSLNKVSYSDSTFDSDYIFRTISEEDDLGRNDLLFYNDSYVILSKTNKKVQEISKLEGSKIGVLTSNLTGISEYLTYGNDLTFSNYEDSVRLFEAFNNGDVDFIIVPKIKYLKEIVDKDYYIVKVLSSLSDSYVLSLSNNNTKLNSIFTKLYNKWYKINFKKLFSNGMNEFYFSNKDLDERSISSFKGKKYIYGYVENIPYEISNTKGLNLEFLKGFENFSGVEFQFKKYSSVKALKTAFDEGKVDIVFNYYNFDSSSCNETINIYNSSFVILSNMNNNITIDSLASLAGKDVYAIKDTTLTNYINNNSKATIKTYSKVKNLLKDKYPMILMDLNTYNYFKNTKLKNYYVAYQGNLDLNYNFLIKRDTTNNTFADVFQYYLSNINHTEYTNKGMNNLVTNNIFKSISFFYYVLIAALVVIVLAILRIRKDKKAKISEERSKYIDALTSLKNRNYLSSTMDKWDENKVYPQSIIVIDLNGLKEINNEHGYQEGDVVIKAAANILINNQLKNTDIIRTDGNEFMIYMVGYAEDQVVLYMRKIYKLMKELPHEKGATLGYSMIVNDAKLIEDAINDAVVDIKKNKENNEKNDKKN